jgi:hypothetical protein
MKKVISGSCAKALPANATQSTAITSGVFKVRGCFFE